MSEPTLTDKVISLYPHNWDQRNNRIRRQLMEQQLDILTGDNYDLYNAIVDAIENNDFSTFAQLVRSANAKV